MPRIRTIKPDFWIDENIARLKRDERLLFIGLWNLADDQGVFKSNTAYIKGQLFSYDEELRISTVEQWLASLTKALMIVPFTFKGESYYVIRTFNEHQVLNRPSKFKFPDELLAKIRKEHSRSTHVVLTEDSLQEGKGKEGNREGKGNDPPDPYFEMFRRCASDEISDDTLIVEIGKFKNKYPKETPATAGALVNAWVGNIGKFKTETNGSHQPTSRAHRQAGNALNLARKVKDKPIT